MRLPGPPDRQPALMASFEKFELKLSMPSARDALTPDALALLQTVASAAEELTTSVAEISRQVTQSSRIAGDAVAEAARSEVLRRASVPLATVARIDLGGQRRRRMVLGAMALSITLVALAMWFTSSLR